MVPFSLILRRTVGQFVREVFTVKPGKLLFSRVGLGAGLVVVLIIAACGGAVSTPTSTPTPSPTATAPATSTPTLLPAGASRAPAVASKTISQIIEELAPSVVHIQTEALQLDQFNQPVPAIGVTGGWVSALNRSVDFSETIEPVP